MTILKRFILIRQVFLVVFFSILSSQALLSQQHGTELWINKKMPTVQINRFNFMKAATRKPKILIIDSSLDEPFSYSKNSSTTSLAYLIGLPENTFVSYSTKMGPSVLDGDGANSPFTKALKNKISTKNLSLIDLFRQVSSEVKNNTDTYKQTT